MDRNESPNPSPRKLKFEQLRADYELFLQTFEKPTQIYRYLRTRHMLSPLFLHRTLSYMRVNRNGKISPQLKRPCKVDSLLEKMENGKDADVSMSEEKEEDCSEGRRYLNMTFSGFFLGPEHGEELLCSDQKKNSCLKEELVNVEVQLIKVLGKRKKDTGSFDSIDLGTCKTCWNPRTQLLPPSSNFTLSVPVSKLQVNTKNVKTHILSIQITLPATRKRPGPKGKKRRKEELCPIEVNGCDQDQCSEPPPKKFKRNLSQDSSTTESESSPNKVYYAQLIIFDRHKNCLLDNGDYELLLNPGCGDENDESKASRRREWELNHTDKLGPYEMFAFGPTIRFQLQWQDEPIYPLDDQPLAFLSELSHTSTSSKTGEVAEQKRVFYQFIYNNNTRQQTEAREDFYCPWCSINCFQLYSLLKHLKTCHSRFMFVYTPLSKGARIDVCLNDNYTSAWNNHGKSSGFSVKCVNVPTRKKSFTEIIVRRAAKLSGDLSEFTEPDIDDLEGVKPFVKGHDRLYYHSSTSQPFGPQEAEEDSEDETLPEWLQEKTNFMIDEFSDVNAGEKELMKLWNLHIITKEYIADFQMPAACRSFVENVGKEVLSKNLKRNFLVHLINLCDFNLIGPATIASTMGHLNAIKVE